MLGLADEEVAAGNNAAEEPDSVAVKPKKAKKRRPADPDAVFKTLARFTGKKPLRTSISQRITSRPLVRIMRG